MEKYYMVTDSSSLHREWFAFKENSNTVREFVKEFLSKNGIEANEYYADNNDLFIVPSGKDTETFNNMLCAGAHDNGLRKFKKNSKIGKAWAKGLEDAGLSIKRKPMLILYFKSSGGRFRSRLFDQDGILYCSLDPAHGETPEGFVEMKASEFFKIIESESVPA